MIITIDGPNSSGKGTLASRLADFYGFAHFDTGMIYRAVALEMKIKGIDIENVSEAEDVARKITYDHIQELSKHPEFRGPEISKNSAIVAGKESVRKILLKMQQDLAKNQDNIIYDGRDTGTVVCPDADLKFFITASAEVRAERRYKFYVSKGIDISYEKVLEDVIARDQRDINRPFAPLKAADDAIVLDTSNMNPEQVFKKACDIIEPYLI